LAALVDGGGSLRRALLGGNLTAAAVNNGWAGIVIGLRAGRGRTRALALMPLRTENATSASATCGATARRMGATGRLAARRRRRHPCDGAPAGLRLAISPAKAFGHAVTSSPQGGLGGKHG